MEALTARVNSDNLNRMRRLKGRLLRATTRVAVVRDEARAPLVRKHRAAEAHGRIVREIRMG